MTEYGISLGSNMGRRLRLLAAARGRIRHLPGVRLLASSPVYETEPVGVPARFRPRRFLNAVVIVQSDLAPLRLLARLHAIERRLGRPRRHPPNAPRTIDLDLLYADDRRCRTPRLVLPHARWARRRFVVQPLADVRPDLRLPGCRRRVAQLLLTLPRRPEVVLFRQRW